MDHIAQIAGKLADHQLDAMLLASQAGEITFCVTERSSNFFAWIAAGAGCLILLAIIFYGSRRIHKKRH